jgi:hypothetical protein
MKKTWFALCVVTLAISIACAFSPTDSAFAASKKQKKMTLEQAWAYCKKKVDAAKGTQSFMVDQSRYQLGASCMHDQGYNI